MYTQRDIRNHTDAVKYHEGAVKECKALDLATGARVHTEAAVAHRAAAEAHRSGDDRAGAKTQRAEAASKAADSMHKSSGGQKDHDVRTYETGSKGGQFYTTATGQKVYINK